MRCALLPILRQLPQRKHILGHIMDKWRKSQIIVSGLVTCHGNGQHHVNSTQDMNLKYLYCIFGKISDAEVYKKIRGNIGNCQRKDIPKRKRLTEHSRTHCDPYTMGG